MEMIELKVGSKGELFLPKSIRTRLNLNPGDKLILDINEDLIILKKIPDLNELLEMPFISKKISVEEADKLILEEQNKQMNKSLADLDG